MLKFGSVVIRKALLYRHMGAAGITSEMVMPQPVGGLKKDKDKGKDVGKDKGKDKDKDNGKSNAETDTESQKSDLDAQMNAVLHLNHAILQSYRKPLEVPTVVGDEEIFTMDLQKVSCPHDLSTHISKVYYANRCQIESAIKAALRAQGAWCLLPAKERLAIWREAANIIESDTMNFKVHLMLTLGKTKADASKDVRRLISSIRTNADYLEHLAQLRFEIHGDVNVFPSFNLRPLDGFVAAMSPFESASLSAGLALCPALMGNTVLWNPALEIASVSYLIYKAFRKAGLPKGVLNFIPANERLFSDVVTDAVHFAGLNYHGSSESYRYIHKLVSDKMDRYICFPRLVAECQGKNFHFVHGSADMEAVCSATIDAAFNFAGQYSNSLSRLFVPSSLWPELKQRLQIAVDELKVGSPTLKNTHMGPVINRMSFERLQKIINRAKRTHTLDVICGGECDQTMGNFVMPTIVEVQDPLDMLLIEPICGPILPVFVYTDDALTDALQLLAHQSKFALSGSIFAQRDEVISHCLKQLRMAASNLYVNERCTGNPHGLTPFGGNRLSGTNDKSGSAYFLMRWSSPLLIEETVDNPINMPRSIEKCS